MLANVNDIRRIFRKKFLANEITRNETGSLSGADTIEIVGASFIADSDRIFGKPDQSYIDREIAWYNSQSLNVNDIPGGAPKIWQAVSGWDGRINSNYGYLIFSKENGYQYSRALNELLKNPASRRATMVYTRPSIHNDWNVHDMSDFICTNDVQYLIRDGKMHAVVQMRSNDAWAGYRNDFAWQKYVLIKLVEEYNEHIKSDTPRVGIGTIHWQVASLHIYERQFYLLDHFAKTGETHITKKEYDVLYAK